MAGGELEFVALSQYEISHGSLCRAPPKHLRNSVMFGSNEEASLAGVGTAGGEPQELSLLFIGQRKGVVAGACGREGVGGMGRTGTAAFYI